jgi:hypothetical protein
MNILTLMKKLALMAATVAFASAAGLAGAAPAQAAARSVYASVINGGADVYGSPGGQSFGFISGQVEAWCFKNANNQIWISISQYQELWVHREVLDLRSNGVPAC